MKHLLVFCLLVYSCSALAQKVKFQLRIATPCGDKEVDDASYTLYPQSSSDTNVYWSELERVYTNLKDTGRYKLRVFNDPFAEIPIITIRDTGLFVYIYHQPKMYFCYGGGVDDPGFYVKCDSAISGYAEDFYKNGNCKIRGTFRKGRIKDSLVTFWYNGHKEKGIYYLKKGSLIEQFDSLGHKISIIQNKPNKTHRLAQYIYADNHIYTETLLGGFHVDEKDFFPDGRIKLRFNSTMRVSYFENGRVDTFYRWKQKKDSVTGLSLLVSRVTHDEDGNVLQSLTAEIWTKDAQPYFEQSKLKYDWVIKSIKYNKRKITLITKDVDADKYFKKYPADL